MSDTYSKYLWIGLCKITLYNKSSGKTVNNICHFVITAVWRWHVFVYKCAKYHLSSYECNPEKKNLQFVPTGKPEINPPSSLCLYTFATPNPPNLPNTPSCSVFSYARLLWINKEPWTKMGCRQMFSPLPSWRLQKGTQEPVTVSWEEIPKVKTYSHNLFLNTKQKQNLQTQEYKKKRCR